MKSLILKDLYNISHNAKSMLFMLIVFACIFIPASNTEGYIFACAILCSMMVVTTFAFDDNSKWNRYAMIMPVSKKDLVAAKFVILTLFCGVGSLFGLTVSAVSGLVRKEIAFCPADIGGLLFLALAACAAALVFGSLSIPLVFRFGAEKGRMLLLISFLIPTAVCLGIYRLLVLFGVEFTDQLVFMLLCFAPVIAFAWCYIMYRISYGIFARQEL